MFRKHFRIRRLVLGLAFAAFAAPAAQASTGYLVDGGPAPVSRVSTITSNPSRPSSFEVTVKQTPSTATESPMPARTPLSTTRRPSSNDATRPRSWTIPVNTEKRLLRAHEERRPPRAAPRFDPAWFVRRC